MSSDLSMLVVEDDVHGREVVRALLSHYEVAVDVAETAESALNFLQDHFYHAVIIDLSLPGMSGWELLKHIQQNPDTAALPCFAITAYHSSIVAREAIDAGFTAYFQKPIDVTTFMQDISYYLN